MYLDLAVEIPKLKTGISRKKIKGIQMELHEMIQLKLMESILEVII